MGESIHHINSTPFSSTTEVQWYRSSMVRYYKKLMGVVALAKVQRQVKFESPRTGKVRGLSDFSSPRTFAKTTTPINSLQY